MSLEVGSRVTLDSEDFRGTNAVVTARLPTGNWECMYVHQGKFYRREFPADSLLEGWDNLRPPANPQTINTELKT